MLDIARLRGLSQTDILATVRAVIRRAGVRGVRIGATPRAQGRFQVRLQESQLPVYASLRPRNRNAAESQATGAELNAPADHHDHMP